MQEIDVPHLPLDSLIEDARVCVGTPDECATVIKQARDKLGLAGIDCTFYFGGIPYESARRSLELFAREVSRASVSRASGGPMLALQPAR